MPPVSPDMAVLGNSPLSSFIRRFKDLKDVVHTAQYYFTIVDKMLSLMRLQHGIRHGT